MRMIRLVRIRQQIPAAIVVILIVLLMLPGETTAIENPPPNTLGLWFDAEGTDAYREIFQGNVFSVYLILHNPEPGLTVSGWEAKIELTDPLGLLRVGYELFGGISYGQGDDFVVGIGRVEPLAYGPSILLAQLTYYCMSPGTDFILSPVTVASVPGQIGLTGGDDIGQLQQAVSIAYLTGQPAASTTDYLYPEIGAELIVDVEPAGAIGNWQVDGPNGFHATGVSDQVLTSLWSGAYVVSWGDSEEWYAPNPDSLVIDLSLWGVETAIGTYTNYPSGLPIQNLPSIFALHGAAPNPFNPQARIHFDLPRDAVVDLTIFDAGGRLVRTLLRKAPLQAGRHDEVWNGCDAAGRPVATGVYLCRMQAGDFVESRRMSLIR